tara:strand:+ start:202 stop:369 length:168 start_codon:yes stop_codon:yes gene_type:complete
MGNVLSIMLSYRIYKNAKKSCCCKKIEKYYDFLVDDVVIKFSELNLEKRELLKIE